MQMIKYLFILALAAIALTGCGAPAGNAPANANGSNSNAAKPTAAVPTKDALMTLEKSAYEAWKTKDAKFWDTFLSGNFVGYGSTGRMDRAAAMKEYSGADCDVKSYELSDDQMTPLGADAAIITYKATVDGTCGGQKLPAATWAAGIYVRDGDKWKGAFHAETPVVDPKAPAKPVAAAKKDDAKMEDAKPDAATDALLTHEKKLWEAWKTKDAKPLEEAFGKDFFWLAGNGRSDRAATIKMWTADNKCEVKSYTLSDAKSVAITNNVSLLTYKGAGDGTCDGKPITTDWYAAVNTKEGENWKSSFGMSVSQ
ncbi:MAG: nuclear transport factor 2 family protein [Pyrinomonadaceae bacterium]